MTDSAGTIDGFFTKNYDHFGPYDPPVGDVIVEKAREVGIRVSTGAAVVEKESGGRPIFGCDHGKWAREEAPWCQDRVTRERVDALIRWVKRGKASNGVGWMQLTYFPFIEQAEALGGAHLPGPNIEVGFRELKRLFMKYDDGSSEGWRQAVASYNGGESNRFDKVPQAYARDVAEKAAAWRKRGVDGEIEEGRSGGALLKAGGGLLKAKEGTNFRKGLDYIIPAIGRTRYKWWIGGPIPDGAPAYAVNRQPPHIEAVIRDGIFCAGVPNLMRRKVGKPIPTLGNVRFDGGIGAYFGDSKSTEGKWGKGYFMGSAERFSVAKCKEWARESLSGVLVGRFYRNVRDQGHVGIVLPSGFILQCFPRSNGPDLNWDYTIEQSHQGYYYEVMVHPSDWIDDKGKITVTKPADKKSARDEAEEQEARKKREEERRHRKEQAKKAGKDQDSLEEVRGKQDGKRSKGDKDDELDEPESIESLAGEDLEDIDLEEIGRETVRFFSTISRSIRESRTLRREAESHYEKEGD